MYQATWFINMRNFACLLYILFCLHLTNGQLEPEHYFTLNEVRTSNYSFFRMENVGEAEHALYCWTPRRPCCREQGLGEWYYPDGTLVPVRAAEQSFFRNRNDEGAIILNRRRNTLTPSGRFKCVIPGANGENVELIAGVYSEQAFPTIVNHPRNVLQAIPDTTVAFTVTARNAVQYRWVLNGDYYLHDTDRISGVNSGTLIIRNVQQEDEGEYHCRVQRLLSRNSESATLTVMDPPVIEQQPANVTNAVLKEAVSFTVLVVGTELDYEWTFASGLLLPFRDSNFQGEQSHTLTIRNLNQQHISNRYRCEVSNPAGTVLSTPVNITLLIPPVIEVQPESVSDVYLGQEVNLSIVASGHDLSYQWQLADGEPIAPVLDLEGVDTPTLRIPSATVEHGQMYRCEVSNRAGSVHSEPASITVVPIPIVASLNATPSITSVQLSWAPTTNETSLKFRVTYYHLTFPSQRTTKEVEEPVFVAMGLMPKGRYRFEVQQITSVFEGGAETVDVRLTENIPAVDSITLSMINTTSFLVSWDPLPSLPGWDLSFYLVRSTTLSSDLPSHPLHTFSDRTTNGSQTLLVVAHGSLLSEERVEVVVGVSGVLDVGVEGVGVIEGERAVTNVTLEQEETAFQIVLGPMDYCISWSDEKTDIIRNDIHSALARVISNACKCNFSTDSLSIGAFSCRGSSNIVTYRSAITGFNSAQSVGHIEQWVKTGSATLLARSFVLDVQNIQDCPVQITSMTEPDCVPNEQGPTPRTLLTSDPAVINCVNRCMLESGSSPLCQVDP